MKKHRDILPDPCNNLKPAELAAVGRLLPHFSAAMVISIQKEEDYRRFNIPQLPPLVAQSLLEETRDVVSHLTFPLCTTRDYPVQLVGLVMVFLNRNPSAPFPPKNLAGGGFLKSRALDVLNHPFLDKGT